MIRSHTTIRARSPFRTASVVLAAPLVALLVASRAAAADPPVLVRGVTVLSIDDAQAAPNQSILIRDGRIVQVGPAAEVRAPRRARVVDAEGQFAIPGLTDAHVHIKRSSADLDQILPLFLAHGVTTVINLDGGPTVLRLREEIAAGERAGPTVFTSGPIIRGFEKMTAENGAKVADDQIAAGYDFLKVYNAIPEAAYHAVVERARDAGVPVVGHAVRSVGIAGALASRQHIVHMEELVYGFFTWDQRPDRPAELPEDRAARLDLLLDEASVPALARRVAEAGIFVTPNLVAYHNIAPQIVDLEGVLAKPEVAWMPESMVRSWQRDRNEYMRGEDLEGFLLSLRRTFPFLEHLTAAFEEAGVPLLAGTDVGIPTIVAGVSMHDELALLVESGLSPQRALAAATTTAARFLRREDAGEIAPGFVADIVLLRESPMDDIENVRTIETVIAGGSVYERRQLDAWLGPATVER